MSWHEESIPFFSGFYTFQVVVWDFFSINTSMNIIYIYISYTPLKLRYISPENWWLENDISFNQLNGPFSGDIFILGGVFQLGSSFISWDLMHPQTLWGREPHKDYRP